MVPSHRISLISKHSLKCSLIEFSQIEQIKCICLKSLWEERALPCVSINTFFIPHPQILRQENEASRKDHQVTMVDEYWHHKPRYKSKTSLDNTAVLHSWPSSVIRIFGFAVRSWWQCCCRKNIILYSGWNSRTRVRDSCFTTFKTNTLIVTFSSTYSGTPRTPEKICSFYDH